MTEVLNKNNDKNNALNKQQVSDTEPDPPSESGKGGQWAAAPVEIDRRRNFAIISHPDAGKTTLTEKLLLYGGAIQEARLIG